MSREAIELIEQLKKQIDDVQFRGGPLSESEYKICNVVGCLIAVILSEAKAVA